MIINKRLTRFYVSRVVEIFLYLLSVLIPYKRGLIIFSKSGERYADNARALFEYIAKNRHESIKVYWLADPRLLPTSIPEAYRELFIRRNSIRGWFYCARSQVVVISHGLGDFGLLKDIAKRKQVVMLWHAITTKFCGLLDEKYDRNMKKDYKSKEAKYYDWLISSSDIDRYYSASYTGMDVNRILVTGLPRNDQIFSRVSDKCRENNSYFRILYSPTFRDFDLNGVSIFFPFNAADDEIAQWATEKKFQFHLRPHPNDTESAKHINELCAQHPLVFQDASPSVHGDVAELLVHVDGVISDYSSIYIDALALDLPVAFVDHDRERYVYERGLAYDYELITPGPKVRNWQDFKYACEAMLTGAMAWSDQRELVRKMFFRYRDPYACSRVSDHLNYIIKKVV